MKRKGKMILLIGMVMMIAGCSKKDKILDPNHPVAITVWHYYNGMQQAVFDRQVKEFNNTVGKEKGIYVKGYSQGTVSELEENILASVKKKVGSEEVPNIFSSYADTAYEIEQMGMLAELQNYLSDEEIDSYMESYIEEGRIGKNGELLIFPTAKGSEIFMMNKTEWDKFEAATGMDIKKLETKEGLVEVAQSYYEWTDSLTPDILNDGTAFYGRDSIANLFIIGSMQLGKEIFEVNNGEATLNIDHEAMKKIWDCYYVPFVKGYFGAYGRFRSDDVKTGNLVAFVGSTSSSMYFPNEIETNDNKEEIDYMILPVPKFEDGQDYIVQQGAGMAVVKGTEQEEYAAVEFLKWFTEKENNIEFGCGSGYLPVKKEAYEKEVLDQVIEERKIEVPEKTYDVLVTEFEVIKNSTMYTNKAFKNGGDARKILEYHLQDKAKEDREQVEQEMAKGKTLEEATEELVGETAFEQWYQEFKTALENAVY